MKSTLSQIALAAAAATMFAGAAISTAQADEARVKCEGINGCKGQGSCKTARNDCKGMNTCKGQGWVETTKQECEAAQAEAAKSKPQ